MTTTSSTTSTSGASILTTLNAGSGVDTTSLISGLVSASFDPKTAALTTKETANTAKVSALGTLTSKIDAFSSALGTLISGGTLFTQPSSSDSTILTATAKSGASIGNLSAQIEVRQTAQAQSVVSPYLASSAASVGQGSLTIKVGSTSTTVTVDSSNNTLAGLARSINSGNSGVTASVVSDATGARLVLKGATGAANAFTITPGANADAGLGRFAYGGTPMTLSGASVSSTYLADATTAPVGQGDFTLTTAGGSTMLTIDAAHDNLTDLAGAITGAGLGVTASVTTDVNGSYLVVTGGSFTLAPAATAHAGLARFAYNSATPAMTQAQEAKDAILRMDGVDVTRASNSIDDLVEGVTVNLVSAKVGTTVTLGSTRPTSAIAQAVSDFVAAYNDLKADIDTATTAPSGTAAAGALYGNSSIRDMQRQLAKLSSTPLSTAGGPSTLAEIGVSTNRDGTLAVDSTVLNKQLAAYPDAVEAMFNPTQHSDNALIRITSAMGAAKPGTYTITNVTAATSTTAAHGTIAGTAALTTGSKLYAANSTAASGLSIEPQGDVASATVTVDLGLGGALQAIRDALRGTSGTLTSLSSQLSTEKTSLATQRTKIEDDQSAYEDRLKSQFSKMDTRVAAYKSIQSFLTQQIDAWNKKSDS